MVKRYSDEEQEAFIEVAKDVGISKAIKELGYPGSWATGNRWFEVRSIEAPVLDEIKARANAMKQALNEKEKLVAGMQGLERVLEMIETVETADDLNKAAQAYQRFITTMNLIEGRSTEVVDNRYGDVTPELQSILNEQEEKNIRKAESVLANN